MPVTATRGARPVLVAAVVTSLGLAGYLFTRPDNTTVIIPSPYDAAIDAPIDAAIDAPIDAPTGPRDPNLAWTRHTIVTHALCDGADGTNVADVNGDGRPDIVTACEQGGKVYVATSTACGVWNIQALPGPTLSAPEDARFYDIDGDGDLDVIEAESGAGRIRGWQNVSGSFSSPVIFFSSTERFQHSIGVDTNKILTGSYSTGASVSILSLTSGTTWSGTWSISSISSAGWVKGLNVVGTDVLVHDYSGTLRGVRWITNFLTAPALGTRLTTDLYTLRGDVKGGQVLTVVGTSDGVSPGASIKIVGGATPTFPSSFGRVQAGTLGDVDGDGADDIVITASHAGTTTTCTTEACDGSPSSVIWMKGPAFTQRGEISGPDGIKHDNAVLVDVNCDGRPDVVTTEEKWLGLIWYENPGGW